MAKETFITKRFSAGTLAIIAQANEIIREYQAQGYTLTLRQLYYQFVSRDLIPNQMKEYKRLGSIISNGRLAGLIDWEAIEDRGRNLVCQSHWSSPSSIIRTALYSYQRDHWEGQTTHVEVWIEKEALVGVISDVCQELDVSYFACRGYNSQSEAYIAGKRFEQMYDEGKEDIVVLHLGDHDPSGIDMARDNQERSAMFSGFSGVRFNRIALNYDQVEEYSPSPNPAKFTDARAVKYVEEFGSSCWELDALEPSVIAQLVRDNIEIHRDEAIFDKVIENENTQKAQLQSCASNWDRIVKFMKKKGM